MIYESQAGFRKGYSTIDHIFVLKMLIDYYMCSRKKKLFCAFVDFEKAFDKVWRDGLWHKMLTNNITCKMWTLIKNMYQGIKSRIVHDNEISAYFMCNNGLRQGENLSPFLFSLYLNDVEDYFVMNDVIGLENLNNDVRDTLGIYFKLFILLYADDTVLISETQDGLQAVLNIFWNIAKHGNLDKRRKDKSSCIFKRKATKLYFQI